jgi:hypothetical protein
MIKRDAILAVYLSQSEAGKEIGDWAEGVCERGQFVATTEEHLTTAIRFLLVQHRLAAARSARREIDMQAVEAHVKRIQNALTGIKNISASVTKGRSALGEIESAADELRREVRDALNSIEEALRSRRE